MQINLQPPVEHPVTSRGQGGSAVGRSADALKPGDILEDTRLTRTQKISLLRDLVYDACELAVAEEEGMGGGVECDAYSVISALNELTPGFDVEHTSPTKHAAFVIR